MKSQKIPSILLICMLLVATEARLQQPDPSRLQDFQPHLAGEVYKPDNIFSGSPFFINAWSIGQVILNSGEIADSCMLRYNGYLDELFWLTHDTYEQVMLDKNLITGFRLFDAASQQWVTFEQIEVNDPLTGAKRKIFAQLLLQDELSLYAYRYVRETGTTTSVMQAGQLVSRRVIGPEYQFFLLNAEGESRRIQMNRRRFLHAFPEKRKELRRELRRMRNSIRSERQLISAVKLLNTIHNTE